MKDVADRRAALVSAPLGPAVLRLALPAVATTMLQLVFLLIDTFWVGRILGSTALAAVSTGGYAVWMLVALAEMIAVGLTAVASRRHGEGAHDRAAVVAGSTLLLALALGLVTMIAGRALMPVVFGAMATPDAVTREGLRYLGTWLLGAPLVFGFFAVEATFRASGDTRTPLMLLGASIVLNLVLDPLLITGAGPLPELGITGAALAAILTRGVALGLGVVIIRRRGLITLASPDWRAAFGAVRIGLPVAANGVFFSLVYMALTRITARFGVPALAALGVGHKLEGLSYMVAVGFGLAAAAVVGQNIGAGRLDRARAAGWITSGYACACGAVVGAVFLMFPDAMVGVFSRDPLVVADGSLYLRAMALAQVTMGLEIVLESALGGAGYTVVPVAWNAAFNASRVPLAAWLAASMGVAGVWWAIGLTAAARGVAMALLWRGTAWQRVRV